MKKNRALSTGLLIIDVQNGLFEKKTPIYKSEELLHNINMLVDRAHDADVTVIFVQHSDGRSLVKGSYDWQLHPELHRMNKDMIIHKSVGNAFENTKLEQILGSEEINSLVMMGLVTHGCVRATCQGALSLGYTVILVKDGHSNFSKDAANLIEQWNNKLEEKGVSVVPATQIVFG